MHNYYNITGQLVETVSPTGTESITAYDSLNRAYLTMDTFNPANGNTADGSMTIFNSQGQSIETENLTGVDISVTLTANTVNGQTIWIASETVVSTGTVMSSTSTAYNPDGTVASTTSATGLVTTYLYYLNGQQESATQLAVPVWNSTSGANVATNLLTGQTYDMLGRTHSSVDARGNTTIYSYLSAGMITTTTYADGTSATQVNDVYGNKVSSTDQNGNTTFYVYNVAGELIEVDQPAVADANNNLQLTTPQTFYTYDAYGDELTQKDANGNVTTFTYDALGHELSRTLPDGESESFTYDSFGRQLTHTDFDGNVTTYHYDSLGRTSEVDYVAATGSGKSNQTVTYTYDNMGRQHTIADASGTTTYTYDVHGNLITDATPEGTIYYGYNNLGEHIETSTAYTDVLYGYDVLGRLTTVTVNELNGSTLGTPLVTTYAYDANGNLAHESLPNGMTTDYTYNSMNELTAETTKNSGGTVLYSVTYLLNFDGTRKSASEYQLESSGLSTTINTTWTYDADGRLTGEAISSAWAGLSQSETWSYDLVGNRIQQVKVVGSTTDTTTSSYNGDNQLTQSVDSITGTTTFTYDANGSLLSQSGGGQNATYAYDLRNKMVSFTSGGVTTTYGYDDVGNRVSETTGGTTTYYLIDADNPTGYPKPIEQKTSLTGAPTMTYILGLAVIAQANSSGTVTYLLTDGHGSTRALLDSNGSVTATLNYDAFGNALGFNPATAGTIFLFGGDGMYDAASALYFHGSGRPSRTDTGEFITADPPTFGSNSDPASLNEYNYCQSDPVNGSDPSGHFDLPELLIVAGAFAAGFGLGYLFSHHSLETNFSPNWGSGFGEVQHGKAWVRLRFPNGSASADEIASLIYADLQNFNYFDVNGDNIASAHVYGNRVSFDTQGGLGYAQGRVDPVDPTVQLVAGPGQYELSGVTLGHHMLSGVRRWRVVIESSNPVVIRVETEAYEQTAGSLWLGIGESNWIGREMPLMGQDAQYEIWDDYLNNIAQHWHDVAGATTNLGAVHMLDEPVGYDNPWRDQLPASLQ